MSPGPDDDSLEPEDGPVLSPEELDISDDERVKELDDGRYVVSSGDPIADAGSEPDPAIESAETGGDTTERPAPADARTGTPQAPSPVESGPDPDSSGTDPSPGSLAEAHEWVSADLDGANCRYGFDITGKFDGSLAQRRMVSNDVVTIFESLVLWYAQQIDRDTPVEEVLGILLRESNAPVRYPTEALHHALRTHDLSPDDSIADMMEAFEQDGGFQLK